MAVISTSYGPMEDFLVGVDSHQIRVENPLCTWLGCCQVKSGKNLEISNYPDNGVVRRVESPKEILITSAETGVSFGTRSERWGPESKVR